MKNRIKELRKENNLTLKELGNNLNMLDSTLSQYENEKRKPTEKIWQALADFFNFSVTYLKGGCTSQDLEKNNREICFEIETKIGIILDKYPNLTWDDQTKILLAISNDIQNNRILNFQPFDTEGE